MAHEYSIKSIVSYKLTMQLTENGQTPFEIYHWDFFTSKRRIGGNDLNAEMINLLRIPTASVDKPQTGPSSPAQAGGIIS
jgi:hypothetical protein